jgi:hypothetical protein
MRDSAQGLRDLHLEGKSRSVQVHQDAQDRRHKRAKPIKNNPRSRTARWVLRQR